MDLDALNDTELAQLAQNLDENANRDTPRDLLKAIINGDDIGLPPNPVDVYRNRIALFVIDDRNWKQLESLIACPLETRDPRSCYVCTDVQVAECVILNRNTIPTENEE